jgi:predicted secreted protein
MAAQGDLLMMTTSHTTLAGLVLACAMTLTLGGCSSAPKTAPRVLSKDVRGAEGQEFVSVAKNQTLSVRLRTDADAGYKWRMSPSFEGNDLLALNDRRTEQDGQGSWDVFTFKTRGTGNTMIEFFCDRPAETEPMPTDKRFTLNVEVMKQSGSQHATVSNP